MFSTVQPSDNKRRYGTNSSGSNVDCCILQTTPVYDGRVKDHEVSRLEFQLLQLRLQLALGLALTLAHTFALALVLVLILALALALALALDLAVTLALALALALAWALLFSFLSKYGDGNHSLLVVSV